MDLQYVEDVAETFVRSALSDVEGAHVFNLAGEIVKMDDLVALFEKLRPGAAKLISVTGPQVPVSFRMDASLLHSTIDGIPRTPLEDGVRKTIDTFERLRSAKAAEARLQRGEEHER
jgi:nucleoside-diphosphate-sugar epimerase